MMRKISASLGGGLMLFMWGFISHGLLPFHDAAYREFADETRVAEVLEEQALGPGLYYVPFDESELSTERTRAFIGLLTPGAGPEIGQQVGVGLLSQVFLVFLVGIFLSPISHRPDIARYALFGLLAGLYTQVFYWNWFGFPALYAAVMIADSTIGWGLAGAAVLVVDRSFRRQGQADIEAFR